MRGHTLPGPAPRWHIPRNLRVYEAKERLTVYSIFTLKFYHNSNCLATVLTEFFSKKDVSKL